MIGVLFSGGKDSVFTLAYYLEQGWSVKCLITLESENKKSWMFHTPAINLAELQAEALGFPLIKKKTKGDKEKELIDLKCALKEAKERFKLTGIAVGAVLSDYQQERVNRICHSFNLKCFAPLWHKDQSKLVMEMIRAGFDIRISGVASYGLDESFLGERIDKKMLSRFLGFYKKFGFHVAGEGGEYESLVINGPIFKKQISLVKTEKVFSGNSGFLNVLSAEIN